MRFLLVRLPLVSIFVLAKGVLCFALVFNSPLSAGGIAQGQLAQISGPSPGQPPAIDAPYPSDHDAQGGGCSPEASPCSRNRFRPNSRKRCPQPVLNCGEGQVPAQGGKRCISVV